MVGAPSLLRLQLGPSPGRGPIRFALSGASAEGALVRVWTPAGALAREWRIPAGDSGAWLYTPKGPAFEAADRAYVRAWGRPLLQVGVGGSIPFVALFGRRFGDLPLILNGVIDPLPTAHGPAESLDLGVFAKAILANVYLYAELARV